MKSPEPVDSTRRLKARRISAIAGTAIFFLLVPGTVAGWVPWSITEWRMNPLPPVLEPFRWLGALLIAAGFTVLVDCFARFAWQGLGVPAPVLPTRRLIVTGWYRYVRNPMYVAVVSTLLGQAILLADGRLLIYTAVVWLCVHTAVLVYEEPALRRSFPEEYATFTVNVPRWIPRLRPWKGK